MNFEYFLYQYLLKNGKAEVPDFGTFAVIKESAKIDAENSVILPPKEIVSFLYNDKIFDNSLAKYIAEDTDSNLYIVQMNLKSEISKWKQQLENGEVLNLENLGQYQLNSDNTVTKIINDDFDIFGLEEINIQKLKSASANSHNADDYKMSKAVLWTFLGLAIVGGVALYYLADDQMLFGKPSALTTKVEPKPKQIKKVVPAVTQDTIKQDSLNNNIDAKIQKTSR